MDIEKLVQDKQRARDRAAWWLKERGYQLGIIVHYERGDSYGYSYVDELLAEFAHKVQDETRLDTLGEVDKAMVILARNLTEIELGTKPTLWNVALQTITKARIAIGSLKGGDDESK